MFFHLKFKLIINNYIVLSLARSDGRSSTIVAYTDDEEMPKYS